MMLCTNFGESSTIIAPRAQLQIFGSKCHNRPLPPAFMYIHLYKEKDSLHLTILHYNYYYIFFTSVDPRPSALLGAGNGIAPVTRQYIRSRENGPTLSLFYLW